jgi:CHAP domain
MKRAQWWWMGGLMTRARLTRRASDRIGSLALVVVLSFVGMAVSTGYDVAGGAPHASAASRNAIVAIAAGEIGNSRFNKLCLKYGPCLQVPWCGMFVNWVWRTAGVSPSPTDWAVWQIERWGRHHGLYKPANPLPGDIVLYDTDSPTGSDHTGIVVGDLGDGRIITIEGNYDHAVRQRVVGPGTDGRIVGYLSPPSTGRVFINRRAANASWVGAHLADGSPTVADVATAAAPNGDVHMFTLGGGKAFTNARRTDGSWTGAFLVDGNGNISDVAAAVTPNGEVHMFTVAEGKVYTNVRRTNGSWTGAFLVDGNGTVGDLAAAALPNGQVLLLTVAGNKVFANLRATNGSWSGAFLADGNGGITDVAAAVTPNGEVHMCATNGSWTGAYLVDGNGNIVNMAAAGSPTNGEVHMATIAP